MISKNERRRGKRLISPLYPQKDSTHRRPNKNFGSHSTREKILYKSYPFSIHGQVVYKTFSRKTKKQRAFTRDDLPHTSRKWISSMLKDDWKVCAKTGSSKIKNEGLHTEKRFRTKQRVFHPSSFHFTWDAFRNNPRKVWTPWWPPWYSYEVSITDEEAALAAQSFWNKKRSLPLMKHNARAAAPSLLCAFLVKKTSTARRGFESSKFCQRALYY